MLHHPTSLALAVALLTIAPATGAAQVCGDAVVDPGEQCDDGARGRLDGCDPACRFEQVQGLTSLALSAGAGPAFCTPATNQLGHALSALGLNALNSALADAIAAGALDQTLVVGELDDPLGHDDPALALGAVAAGGDPASPVTGLDSWHLGDSSHLSPDLAPLSVLPGSLSSSLLTAGPGTLDLPMPGGSFRVRDGRAAATVGAASSQPGPPPAAFAAGFTAFETLAADAAGQGLCGNVTVASLAAVPIPVEFTAGGSFACAAACAGSRAYLYCGDGQPVGASCNSFLDLLVGGCALPAFICARMVTPTQPDVGTGGSPPALLVADPTTGKVTVVVGDDAYSSHFSFAAQRVHLVNGLYQVFADDFEGGDASAWSASTP